MFYVLIKYVKSFSVLSPCCANVQSVDKVNQVSQCLSNPGNTKVQCIDRVD